MRLRVLQPLITNFLRPNASRSRPSLLPRAILLAASLLLMNRTVQAQQLLKNGSFDNSSANWITTCTSIEAYLSETSYGGTSAANKVAEVDDESCFYQDVCVLPGKDYIFSMFASRRTGNGASANPLTSHIKIEGLNAANTVVGTPLVDMDFTRTNTTFSLTPVTGIPVFNVPLASGIVRLRIKLTDNSTGFSTLGMIVDDLSLTYAIPPKIVSVDTVCQNLLHTLSIADLPASGITYDWDFGTNATPATSVAAAPSVSWSTTGLKTVRCLLGNGSCTADTMFKNIYVASNPAAPVVSTPLHYCTGQAASALTATGTNLLWYTTASGGTGSATAPVPSTASAGTVTYYVSQSVGICESGRASITVNVHDAVTASFSYTVKYGCTQDTVVFSNLSTGNGAYEWSFGDGTTSPSPNPIHIYTSQGSYAVKLKSTGSTYCVDSVIQTINLTHPLQAAFSVDQDTVCLGQPVTVTNTSTATSGNGIDPSYRWSFGDGLFDNSSTPPPHIYTGPGVYDIRLVATNFVPCSDSTVIRVYVDTISYLSVTASDTEICDGKAITVEAHLQQVGLNGLSWDFGDGISVSQLNPVTHAYDTPGVYPVIASAVYRVCPPAADTVYVRVKPYPRVDLGPDTSICPGGQAVVLNGIADQPADHWHWNTGDTTTSVLVRHHGLYYATVSRDGCSATDSVTVYKDCYIDVPNVFTPNGDGLNDYFFPRQLLSRSVSRFSMMIFNRWGALIFKTDQPDGRGWDGKLNGEPQPQGVYIYLIEAGFVNGASEKYQGNVTLMR